MKRALTPCLWWLVAWLVLAAGLSVGRAAEQTLTIPGSTVTFEIENGVFHIRSAQLEKRQDNTYSQVFFIRTVNNVQSGPDIISVNGFGITAGQQQTFTSPGSHTMTSGYYYRVAIRRIGGSFVYEQQAHDFQFNGTNRVRIAGTNDKPYKIRIALIGNVTGDIVHAVEVAAGQAYDETFVLDPPDVTVTPHVFIQAAFEDGIWTELPEGEFGEDPAQVGEPIPGVPDATPEPASIDGAGLPGGKPAPTSQGQVVWRSGGATTPETALDKATFQEGINKLLEKSSSGAGGSTDMTATNAKLDSIKTNTATTATAAQGANVRLDAIKNGINGVPVTVEADTSDVVTKGAEKPWVVPGTANLFPTGENIPSFFDGPIGTSTQISATIPSFSVLGATWPTYNFEFDLAQHSTATNWFRTVCSIAVHIAFFLLFIKTGRNASAGGS